MLLSQWKRNEKEKKEIKRKVEVSMPPSSVYAKRNNI